MAEVYFNNAWTKLVADLAIGDTSCTVDNSAPFTPLAPGDWFRISMWNEVIKVTDITGDVWTIVREFEGVTSGLTPIGTALIHQPTAGMFTDLPPGPAGADGQPVYNFGADGIDGNDGMPIPGIQGATGTTGAQGPMGPPGIGEDGPQGDMGMPIPGPQGPTGASGSTAYVGVHSYNSGTQTASANTDNLILFNTDRFDTDGFHDTGTNTERFTVPTGKAGKYRGTIQLAMTARLVNSGATEPNVQIRLNNTTVLAIGLFSDSQYMNLTCPDIDLAVGDYLNCTVYPGTANATINNAQRYSCEFSMRFLGA